MIWQLAIFTLAFYSFLFYKWQRRRIYELFKQVPRCGLPHWPVLGVAHLFSGSSEDRMNTIQKLGRDSIQQGGITIAWMVNKPYVIVADPVIADIVLKSCLEKDDTTMKFIRIVLGDGSIFAPVAIWRHRRKIVAPVFSLKNLNSFVPVFQEQSSIMVQCLEKEAGADFSFWKYITTYTFDAICKTSLGIDLHSQGNPNHPFLEAFSVTLQLTAARLCKPWLYLDFVYERLTEHKTLIANRELMYKFVDKLIETKRKEIVEREICENQEKAKDDFRTLLEMLIDSSGKTNGYTLKELREELLVIILAGTDTSAVGAAYTALMLSRYPQVQDKLYKELQDIFGDTNRPVTVQDLPRLKYLEAVIKETLRLYPAVPAIMREVRDDVKLPSGVTLVNGVGILMNFWALHRHPAYWGHDAEKFRPERFLMEGPLKHSAQFMPFSYSVRNCIGSTYAMMSMKTVLSTLIRRYRLLPPSDLKPHQWTQPLRVEFDIMMKHVDKYTIRIENRN